MARKPDLPCAGCGKLMWRSATSLPEGQARCRPCRSEAKPQTCEWCGTKFKGHRSSQIACSLSCANHLRHRESGHTARVARTCEICGSTFNASYVGQRTCSRACGVALRKATGTMPELKPKFCRISSVTCDQCGTLFTARSSRTKRCSNTCRISASGARVNDLYALACELGVNGYQWRDLLLGYLSERDGDRCGICGELMDFEIASGPKGEDSGVSIDHVMPRSLGGSDDPNNLRLTHWGCNRKRGAARGEQLALIG